jgi:hypothetical protein
MLTCILLLLINLWLEEQLLIELLLLVRRPPWNLRTRNVYFQKIFPVINDVEFYDTFRMDRDTFAYVVNLLRPFVKSDRELTVEKKFGLLLYRMAHNCTTRQICLQMDTSKGSLHKLCKEILDIFKKKLFPRFVRWPTATELMIIKKEFSEMAGFPDVVGAIDGSHIKIHKPPFSDSSYFNRKKDYSIILQAVVDSDMQFININVGYPGSVHDSRVFKNSALGTALGELLSPNENIIGDNGYPLMEQLLVPFVARGPLNHVQRNFNKCLSSTRVIVERAFGQLKGRFSMLYKGSKNSKQFMQDSVIAACTLHNIIRKRGLPLVEEPPIEEDNVVVDDEHRPTLDAKRKRARIAQMLL